jgi:hypothetical protein
LYNLYFLKEHCVSSRRKKISYIVNFGAMSFFYWWKALWHLYNLYFHKEHCILSKGKKIDYIVNLGKPYDTCIVNFSVMVSFLYGEF